MVSREGVERESFCYSQKDAQTKQGEQVVFASHFPADAVGCQYVIVGL